MPDTHSPIRSLTDLGFSADQELERHVATDARLVAMLPADELVPMVDRYNAARALAASVPLNPTVGYSTMAAEIRSAIDAGQPVDPEKLAERIVREKALVDGTRDAKGVLQGVVAAYRQDVANLIRRSVPDFYAGLSAQLDDLLDRAEDVLRDLDGALDPEAAMDAGKAEEWRAFRRLAREYADLRASHLALLNLRRPGLFGEVDSPHRAVAFWGGLLDADPDLVRRARAGGRTHDGILRVADDAPFPVGDPEDHAHWLAAVSSRGLLRPHVVTADDAIAAYKAARRAEDEADEHTHATPHGRMAESYGGEDAVMRRYGLA